MSVTYLPDFGSAYIDPSLAYTEILAKAEKRKSQIELALKLLSTPDPDHPSEAYARRLQGRTTCCSSTNNSAYNLACYLLRQAPQVARSACCCVPRNHHAGSIRRPVPKSAYDTLAHTRTQFERNTFGLFCIAPAAIIAAPLISVNTTVNILLGILANLTITTTAGTNTYVFSGDIGAVSDGRGELVIQGGIRVDAIAEIKQAYKDLSDYLIEKYNAAKDDKSERSRLEELAGEISANWQDIYHGIADCGIKTSSVEEILAPFAKTLTLLKKESAIAIPSCVTGHDKES